MITEDKVTEIFYIADNFCKVFDAQMEKYTIKSNSKRRYHRESTMSKAEIMVNRCSKLFYSIHAGENQFDIALPYSFAPTAVFHQSRSPLRSIFKTTVGTQ